MICFAVVSWELQVSAVVSVRQGPLDNVLSDCWDSVGLVWGQF